MQKMLAISEVNNFLSRKEWIMIKRRKVKEICKKQVPMKWVFKSKEDTDGKMFCSQEMQLRDI